MENFSIPETMKAMTLVAYDKLQLATCLLYTSPSPRDA